MDITVADAKSYLMPSDTDPDKTYELAIVNGNIVCDCQGFQHRQTCKHATRLEQRLRGEPETQQHKFGERPSVVTDTTSPVEEVCVDPDMKPLCHVRCPLPFDGPSDWYMLVPGEVA